MALQKDIEDDRFGSLVTGAYLKLAYLRWSDADMKVMATVSIFATAEAKAERKECISNIEIDVTDLFPNIQAQLYARIKNDPQFIDAIDV